MARGFKGHRSIIELTRIMWQPPLDSNQHRMASEASILPLEQEVSKLGTGLSPLTPSLTGSFRTGGRCKPTVRATFPIGWYQM